MRDFRQIRLKTCSGKKKAVAVIPIVMWETKQVATVKPSTLTLGKVYEKGTVSAEA